MRIHPKFIQDLPEQVAGKIDNPASKLNGQFLMYDSNLGQWVAENVIAARISHHSFVAKDSVEIEHNLGVVPMYQVYDGEFREANVGRANEKRPNQFRSGAGVIIQMVGMLDDDLYSVDHLSVNKSVFNFSKILNGTIILVG